MNKCSAEARGLRKYYRLYTVCTILKYNVVYMFMSPVCVYVCLHGCPTLTGRGKRKFVFPSFHVNAFPSCHRAVLAIAPSFIYTSNMYFVQFVRSVRSQSTPAVRKSRLLLTVSVRVMQLIWVFFFSLSLSRNAEKARRPRISSHECEIPTVETFSDGRNPHNAINQCYR